ncbi:MAG: hypothetical protein WA021_04465, partial [Minisyncoccia bacterium]
MALSTPNRAALIGLLLVLPFIILNFIVALRIEPVYSFLGSIGLLSSSPWLPTLLLLLFPIAFFITIRPMLTKCDAGYYRFYPLNIILGALILAATIF